jgi:hypothetical protein
MPLHRSLIGTLALLGAAACAGPDVASPSALADGPAATASHGTRSPGSRAYQTSAANRGHLVRCETGAAEGRAVIGPKGGILNVGPHRVIFPAGALDKPVEVSGVVPEDTAITIWLEPHGLTFRKPVGLQLHAGTCESVPDVIYVGEAVGDEPVYIRAIYSAWWKAVAAPLDHFSGYAIAFRDPSCNSDPAEPDGEPAQCGDGAR